MMLTMPSRMRIRPRPNSSTCCWLTRRGQAAQPPRTHLQQRDGWDMACAEEESVHLMVQVMETWIVADASGVGSYYGPSLLEKALPRAQNLETVGKERIYKALEHATTKTQKGPYHKINHAAALLEAIDPRVVRTRCPSCDRLFVTLLRAITTP